MAGQSYGDAGAFLVTGNGELADVTGWQQVVVPSTAEPSMIEVCAGSNGLVVTGVDFINDVAGTTAAETITFKQRPRPFTEGSETSLGTASISVAQMTTVGDVIRCVFQPYGQSGVNQFGFKIPPGQSFVVASGGTSTAWQCVCVVRGYTITWGSEKIDSDGELIEADGTKKIYNVLIGA